MSIENEVQPQGPSKVSRRNLIAGAALAVPTVAVVNAGSAWASPVVTSLIGMPALVASKTYHFTELFQFTAGTGLLSANDKSIAVSGVGFKNISGEYLSVTVTPSVSGCLVNPASVTFGLAANETHSVGFTITKPGGTKFTSGGTSLTVTLTVIVAGAHAVDGAPGFTVSV